MSSSTSKLLTFSKKFFFLKKLYFFYNIYLRNYKFYFSGAQFGEDRKFLKYFKKKHKGTYVDLGCFHPTRYNNTFRMYKKGWKGLNVDLNPFTIELFNFARPRDINVCAALSEKKANKKIYFLGDLNSQNTLEKNHTKWLRSHFGYKKKDILVKKIKTQKIGDILEKYKIYNIDFMNIDLEGHEIKILKTLNLKKFNVKYFCVEILTHDKITTNNKKKIISFFLKNKYKLKSIHNINYIFEKKTH